MAKIALVLSALAVVLAALPHLKGGGGRASEGAAAPSAGLEDREAFLREVTTVARREAQQQIGDTLQRDVDARVVRLDTTRKQQQEALAEVQRLSESSADSGVVRVE
jgi:hypothetical protein